MFSRRNLLECRRQLAPTSLVDRTMVAARTDIMTSAQAPRTASASKGQPTSSLVERGSNLSNEGRTNPKVTREARSTGSMRIVNSRLAIVTGAREKTDGLKRRPTHIQSTDVPARTMNKTAQHSEMDSR